MHSTNDPALKSFLPVPPDSHFPIQNLPYGVFRLHSGRATSIGVAIGDQILDLTILEAQGLFSGPTLRNHRVFSTGRLNEFMARGRAAWTEARMAISRLLRAEEPTL